MMTQKELRRLHIIHKVLEGEIKQTEGSRILCLSERQVRRIVKRVRDIGDKGIVHKSRSKASNRRYCSGRKERVLQLYRERYRGFGPTLYSEKLYEAEGLRISDETLRLRLIESGEWKKKRKRKAHRQWRQRKDHIGEMVQIDGSHHDWLEGRGPWCVLMGYIDDATGTIFGRFYDYEGTMPAMDSIKRYIERHGIPQSIYLDRHSTYKSTGKPTIEEELNGTGPMSEFERAMRELGVKVIHANSPQAKGRIERLFNTLQDRLVKEMRLKGINKIEDANRFLTTYIPSHNKRFAVSPQGKADLHRKPPKGINLDGILCIKAKRVLRGDFTISYNRRLYQVEDNIRAKKVIVEQRIDGSMVLTYKGNPVKFKEIETRPKKAEKEKAIFTNRACASRTQTGRKTSRPSPDHPWRRFKYGRQKNVLQQKEPTEVIT
jgi:transposase-like protein